MKKGKKGKIYVADGNWLLHRVFFTLRTHRPIEEALPYAFLSLVCKDAIATRADRMLIAFDGPKVFRYALYPEYKANRDDKKSSGPVVDTQFTQPQGDVYDYLPDVYRLLTEAGITYFQPRKYEADDVLRSVVHEYVPEYSVVCGAQDKDDYQFLGPGVSLYDSSRKGPDGKPKPATITAKSVMEEFGLTPAQFLQYQILLGDPIDNIPRIGNFKPLGIRKKLIEHGTIADWYKAEPDDQRTFDVNRVKIALNRKLVTLCKGVLPPSTPDEWKPPKVKSDEAHGFPETYHAWHSTLYPKSRGLFG
ncbi:5'-3' exonuclease [Burkholderia phage BcepSaruman]|uniref:5'-3' exonuclease n=1 Tax=Burkholderia phage BcepSaruman TaxID=2530032 RepID=A0A4D5ZDC1_9CAUD|nr:5'-3' exonuclease [Burkholderia phage BcepSaruman]QBX06699.1 5'-3' exonuclease [Burkholderia phage BcepSaruman]